MDLHPHHADAVAAADAASDAAAETAAGDSSELLFDFPGVKLDTVAKLLKAGCKLYLM
jgi:hypothetical protein